MELSEWAVPRRLLVGVLFALLLVNVAFSQEEDLAKQLLEMESRPEAGQFGLREYQSVLDRLFDSSGSIGIVQLRRDPSFGYPTQVVLVMGSPVRVISYEISNPIVIPKRSVSLYEHLSLLALKLHTTDPEKLAERIKVTKSILDSTRYEPFLSEIERLPLAPEFNRTDAFEVGVDGTNYSLVIRDSMEEYNFRFHSAATLTPAQQKLYEVFRRVWKDAFPMVSFKSAR